MKIKCDVCDKEEAMVFCSSDEAALCNGCDNVVHLANKLASKHLRFPLLTTSSPKHSPLCDFCKERRAFLFYREDRAFFCSECDTCNHEANIHKQNHSRFLLTGIQLSSSVSKSSSSSSSLLPISSCPDIQSSSELSVESCINNIIQNSMTLHKTSSDDSSNNYWHPYCTSTSTSTSSNDHHHQIINYHHQAAAATTAGSSSSSSSTSMCMNMMSHEYPTEEEEETLPAGWKFEDFLDPSCFTNE